MREISDYGPFVSELLARDGIAAQVLAALPPQRPDPAAADTGAELRRARNREWARIALRDRHGLASLDQTLGDLSAFADAACERALQAAELGLRPRYGQPRGERGALVRPVVLGMGKLGGRELNFSSDIDLILAYTEAGETDGGKRISNGEYFVKLAQEFVRLLSEHTAAGFAFRVDLMLRPFGSAGPVAIPVDAMEDYYQNHGRDWERYALIKARPVAGDLVAGEALLARLTPFVYRRYLDFNALAGLRELKRKIAADALARGLADDDLKLGDGGIRECEFIVQSFQLVRGGQDARLRGRELRPMLRRLAELGHLPAATAAELDQAYVLLRRAENAVQSYADQQTHALPTTPERLAWLAAALGYPDWPALQAVLRQARERVSRSFNELFAEPDAVPQRPAAQAATALWRGEGEQALAALAAAGFRDADAELSQAVQILREHPRLRTASEATQQRLSELLPLLAEDAIAATAADLSPCTALKRALEVVTAVLGRSTYLTLLRESAGARRNLLQLCAASPWIAATLARHPVLLDQLLDSRSLYHPPDREQLREGLLPRVAALPVGDVEAAMDLLRRYVQETTLRIAAAEVVNALPLVQVSDRLTWLAEAVVEAAVADAEREMRAVHGDPRRADCAPAGFSVIGYGKLGALEMGYGSDLDLVFVHDAEPADADTVGGSRPLPQSTWMARLAQRVIHRLTTQTHLGRAYEVDMQLRPNGGSGLPVVTLASFADYQRHKAWTWEHQALSRARHIAGTPALGAAFEQIRREVLCRPREAGKLRQEIVEMRDKMRAHLDKPRAGRWDVKQGEGGLIDVEFLVQYWVLSQAAAHPELVHWPDVWRQLDALAAAGLLAPEQASALLDAQRAYRAHLHQRLLRGESADAGEAQFAEARAVVTAVWHGALATGAGA
ncbi:MAG: bifunctional [glutamate--ammonia ligase]-adenylyl-L-tyrosine phosphorylase/[glutamate--ammonia-ligase] adenylyltransferase [Stagnimonas sp.]|nr:bifunctional [glutamate--ammonia ligase]-adenylyl-L-tyrosine phosphorylase/[glutamate--ammonia-ligase] adenylyltransferase [Stagnimonas sp.]